MAKRLKSLQSVSLLQVAQQSGVSGCTASRVLNGKAKDISLATHERVRQAAQDMGYVPNRMARSMGRGRTDTLGMMISGQANPFFTQIIEAVETEGLRFGYQSLVDAGPSQRGTSAGHGKLRGWPVDGIIMWTNGADRAADYLGPSAAQTPVVYLSGSPILDVDNVYFDGSEGVRQAITHLLARGKRRIAYLAPFPLSEIYHDPRYDAYADACREAGLPVRFLETPEHEETRAAGLTVGQELARQGVAERPDAVLCHNDMLAVGVNCGLRRAGVRVPRDVAVVGQDGTEEGAYLVEPLTSIVAPAQPLCEAALALLLRRMAADNDDLPQHICISTELRIGMTS